MEGDKPYVTDNSNYIVDLYFQVGPHCLCRRPAGLSQALQCAVIHQMCRYPSTGSTSKGVPQHLVLLY
jgi:hypothetical protein